MRAVVEKMWEWLKEQGGALLSVITVAAGLTAAIADFFVTIPADKLTTLTVALLALLAGSSLWERRVRIDRIDDRTTATHAYLSSGSMVEDVTRAVNPGYETLEHFQTAGLTRVYENLGEAGLVAKLRAARSIRILATWMGNRNEVNGVLAERARQGCKVQVLLLQHDSEYARLRSREIGYGNDDHASGEICADLSDFQRLCQDTKVAANLEVKAYDGSPVTYMVAYDNTRLLGYFWRKRPSVETPYFELSGSKPEEGGRDERSAVVKMIDEHFDNVWDDSKTKYVRMEGGIPAYVDDRDQAWA
jgi:Domain of unknown function (DUF5919)